MPESNFNAWSYRRLRRQFGFSAALMLTGAAVLAQEPPNEAGAGHPRIELSAHDWDFGEKWSGQPVETVLKVRNIGERPLIIKKVGRDCACVVARLNRMRLEPGESVDVAIAYNTKKPKSKASQKVWLETNDPDTPVATFNVTGHVKQVFNINVAHELTFGLLGRTDSVERSFEIESYYDKPVRLKLEPLDSDQFTARLETLEDGKRYKLIASTKSPLSYGPLHATAQIATGLEFLPELPVHLSGFVQAVVAVEPDEIFVLDKMTRRSLRILRVTSRRDKPLNITGIVSSDPSVKAELMPVEAAPPDDGTSPHHERKIRVSLPPASELPADGVTITIKTDDPEFKELTASVRLKKLSEARKD